MGQLDDDPDLFRAAIEYLKREGVEGASAGRTAPMLKHGQVRAIRADARSLRVIAADYGVSSNTVANVKNRTTYRWVK